MAFVMIDDEVWINDENIARIEHPSRDEWQVYTKTGAKFESHEIFIDDILGKTRIVQLVPLNDFTSGMMAQYKGLNAKEDWYKEKVDAIAVCADGSLRPINYAMYFANFEFMDESMFEILTPSYWQRCDRDEELGKCSVFKEGV